MPAAGMVNGPLHAVPCAHCGRPNDLRDLDGQKILEVGSGLVCDHCGRTSKIAGIKELKIVVLKQM